MSDQESTINKLAGKFGYLPYMVKRYIQFLGLDDTIKLLIANEKPLIPTIRVNTLKISIQKFLDRFNKKGIQCKAIANIPYGFKVLNLPYNLGSQHEYLQGYYYIQNLASMLPAIMLDPHINDLVVDMCAAPGSKATQLSQIMENKGIVILIDRNRNRIPALQVNINRMGIHNTVVLNFDSRNLKYLKMKAKKILLDAPCTGEGLIREDPSRKRSKEIKDIRKMAKIQNKLLKAGLDTLELGGELLYSTCSIAPEENELVIQSTLENNHNFSIIEMPYKFGDNGLTKFNEFLFRKDMVHAQRLYPHIHDTIGFFMCKIKRLF